MKTMMIRVLIGLIFLSVNRAYAQFDFNSGGSIYNELSNSAVPLPAEPSKAGSTLAPWDNNYMVLPGGAATFDKRSELIRSAKKSVYLTSLSIRGDETGRRTAGLLLAKKKEGLDVRLTMDKTAAGLCEKGLLAELSAAGIPVLLYQISANVHCKLYPEMLLIDGKYVVLGGIRSDNEGPRMAGGQKVRYTEPPAHNSDLDDAVVFFFQASDSTGTTNQKRSNMEAPSQNCTRDDAVVFFFQATDETKPK